MVGRSSKKALETRRRNANATAIYE